MKQANSPPKSDLTDIETPHKDVGVISLLSSNPEPGHCLTCGFPPNTPGSLKGYSIDKPLGIPVPCPDCHFTKRGAQKDQSGQLQGDLVFKTLDNYDCLTEADRLALTEARSFVKQPYGWLTYYGEYGAGKTHLGAAIANALGPERARYFNVPDLASKLRESLSDNVERFIGAINQIPILILDELEDGHFRGGWSKEQLQRIIDYRYRELSKRQLVICTNWSPEQYDGDLRFIGSRMRDERFVCIELKEDNRPIAKQLSQGGARPSEKW